MKTFVAALASVSLLAAPLALGPTPAMAQHSHGGMGGHGFSGGFSHGGHFHGGFGFHGGYGFHGHGFYGYSPFYAGFFGLALGAAIAGPWYYDYPSYYGYYGPYGAPYADDYYGAPPPPDGYDEGAPPQYQSQPHGAVQGQACGSWSWDAAQSKYDWVSC